jgi:hypothetical protein
MAWKQLFFFIFFSSSNKQGRAFKYWKCIYNYIYIIIYIVIYIVIYLSGVCDCIWYNQVFGDLLGLWAISWDLNLQRWKLALRQRPRSCYMLKSTHRSISGSLMPLLLIQHCNGTSGDNFQSIFLATRCMVVHVWSCQQDGFVWVPGYSKIHWVYHILFPILSTNRYIGSKVKPRWFNHHLLNWGDPK